jgi:hypothetical protein
VKRSVLTATAVLGFSGLFLGPFSGSASAVELEASGTFGLAPYTIGIALRDLPLSEEIKLEFGITNRAASTGLAYATDFGPIGRLSSTLRFAYVYDPFRTDNTDKKLDPGIRLRLGARGTLASVGVEGQFGYWNVAADGANPTSIFEREAEPISDDGWLLGFNAQYRLSRVLVLSGGAKYTTDASRLNLKLEGREAESELSYSGGILIGFQEATTSYLGELGLKYSPAEQPYTMDLGVQVGLRASTKKDNQDPSTFDYGLSFGISTDLPDELGSVSAFGVWEPWRLDVYPIRYGLETNFNLGGGVLFVRALGGSFGGGIFPWVAQLGFRLPLDALLNPQP